MVAKSSPRPLRADAVLARIRADILNGYLAPGSRLGFSNLSSRYEASTGVLREVLPRLVEQGLAESEAQLGFRVVKVSVERLTQLTDARVAIEGLVSQMAVEQGGLAWESDVVAKHHALARTPGDPSTSDHITEDWLAAHEAFHIALLSGCMNTYLVDTAVRLRSIFEVYRCWSHPAHARTSRDIVREHREMMEAAIARDVRSAVDLCEAHIRRTTELLIASQHLESPVANSA